MTSIFRWKAVLFGSLLPVAATAQSDRTIVFSPESQWHLNYADDSCRLARTFTNGSDRMIFYMDAFEPGPNFTVLVAGPAMRNSGNRPVKVSFGPVGATLEINQAMAAELDEFGPAILINGMSLIENPTPASAPGPGGSPPLTELVQQRSRYIATPAEAKAISWFEVERGKRAPLRFALGPMDRPVKSLQACVDNLLESWGVDVAAHQTLSRNVTPRTNPGSWVSSNDYPLELSRQGIEGLIQFRLSISEDGTVSACHIQQSTRPARFDKAVCDVMSRRARFNPALDAAGKPIKSYWRSSFRFIMP